MVTAYTRSVLHSAIKRIVRLKDAQRRGMSVLRTGKLPYLRSEIFANCLMTETHAKNGVRGMALTDKAQ